MKNISKYLLWVTLVLLLPAFAVSCGDSKEEPDGPVNPTGDFDVQFTVPATIDVVKGGTIEFAVLNGKAPLATDVMMLESSGVSTTAKIETVAADKFTVKLPETLVSGDYRVALKRDTRKKTYGTLHINIVKDIITPDAGTTVFGVISTEDGMPVAGVVVSDGDEVVTTNDKGVYQIKSAKKWGYVFMSIPSGYEALADGILPQFYSLLKNDANTAERVDFTLKPVSGQDNYKVFFLGDMHLANRTNDEAQFNKVMADFNNYRYAHASEKMYAVTLGDMTWDLYWVSRKYGLPEYLKTVNGQVKGIQIFHTMGNHDNEMETFSDFDAEVKYRRTIAPTYYSFNIGKVHYVVMDDIDCSDYDGTSSRNYQVRISSDQLQWLRKDLEHVAKGSTVIATMHSQICAEPTSNTSASISHASVASASMKNMFEIFNGYKVYFVTGHTHKNYTLTATQMNTVGGHDFTEHNVAAICSSWWWSGNLTPGVHVSLDGSPGGYAIWDVKGSNIESMLYKAAGYPESHQFHSYDLNNVSFSMDDVPGMSSSLNSAFQPYVSAYPKNSKNEVLINVWNWNPAWTVTVTTQSGQNLAVTKTSAYDPLHIAALTVKRFAGATSKPSFITERSHHFFKVTAPDADTDLVITVKDEFGHTWTENMARPKAFSTDAYKMQN